MDIQTEPKPEIRPQVMRRDEERKAGGLGLLLSKLGLGGGTAGSGTALGGLGAAAAGGHSGLIAFAILGSSIAASLGYLYLDSGANSFGTSGGAAVFSAQREHSVGDPTTAIASANPGYAAAGAEGSITSSSLDYLNKANSGALPDANASGEGDQVATNDAAASTPESASVAAPDNSFGAANTSSAKVNKPQMVKSKGFGGAASSGGPGSGQFAMNARPDGAANRGGFEKAGATSGFRQTQTGTRTRMGANRTAVSRGAGDPSPSKQGADTHRVLASALKGPNLTSAGAGRGYDGGRGSFGAAGHDATTVGAGGAGDTPNGITQGKPNPNTVQNLREVPQPQEVSDKNTKDKTPWKKEAKIGQYALLIAGVLLAAAALITDPGTKMRQVLAGLAMAAAGVAVAMGLVMAMKHGQTMQGLMYAGMGALLAFGAWKVFNEDKSAAQEAKEASEAKQKDMNTDIDKHLDGQTGKDGAFEGKKFDTIKKPQDASLKDVQGMKEGAQVQYRATGDLKPGGSVKGFRYIDGLAPDKGGVTSGNFNMNDVVGTDQVAFSPDPPPKVP